MYTDITQKTYGHHARLKAGAHEGACMVLKHASETDILPGKYPNQYTRRTRRGS